MLFCLMLQKKRIVTNFTQADAYDHCTGVPFGLYNAPTIFLEILFSVSLCFLLILFFLPLFHTISFYLDLSSALHLAHVCSATVGVYISALHVDCSWCVSLLPLGMGHNG